MSTNTTIPAPGYYPGFPEDAYRAVPAACQSTLTHFRKCAAWARYRLDNPTQTKDQEFGVAVHALVWEYERFYAGYGVLPDFGDMRSSTNRAKRDAYIAANSGVKWMAPDDRAAALAAHASLMANDDARKIIESAGDHEVSAFWMADGVLCKCRADKVCGDVLVADLKTTDDASPSGFLRSVLKWGYHRQAAFYLRGLAAVGHPIDAFWIIAVEKEPPYLSAAYALDDELVEMGWREMQPLFEQYVEAVKTGVWGGYRKQLLTAPRWARQQDTNQKREGSYDPYADSIYE